MCIIVLYLLWKNRRMHAKCHYLSFFSVLVLSFRINPLLTAVFCPLFHQYLGIKLQ